MASGGASPLKDDCLWDRADRLFDEALDLPPGERAAFLDRACGEDVPLRELVDRLLASAEDDTSAIEPGGALKGPLWSQLQGELTREDELLPGTLVGRYRVVRELGRGGMAAVYLAERADGQFEQQVALKLLKRGIDTDEIVGRFDQERQILARARHPGIARLLDGGVGPGGRPYLVMEYVLGRPIDAYCDDQRLPIPDRLRLFLQAARAVEDAHRNLVVHRDLKPGNILVTTDGHAKLLDFGIAKLLDPEADATPVTRTASRMLTPAWASPEQLAGAPVTTASDVYQLGLLLHLLLAGRLPDPRGGGEITRPSSTQASDEAAWSRLTTPARLQKELAGDLDTIVLTALRPEPERRYGSVAQLIDDVERYLAGRPVSARPDTLGYRTGKFVRRHTAAVSTAALALMLLVTVVVLYTIQLTRERDRAELSALRATQVSGFLRGLFEVSAPTRSRGEQITARQLLDQGAARIDAELAGQPEVQAEMMTLIGDVYRELALYEESEAILTRAVALRRERPGAGGLDLAASLHSLAKLRTEKAEHAAARKLYEEALALREAALGPDHPDVARTLTGLGRELASQGDFLTARRHQERALAILEKSLGRSHSEVGFALRDLGLTLFEAREAKAALPRLTRALEVLEARHGPGHPDVAKVQVHLGNALLAAGDREGARVRFKRALPVLEKVYGTDHPDLAMVMFTLGDLLISPGIHDKDPEGAIGYHWRAWEIRKSMLGPYHPQVAASLDGLGRAYLLLEDDAKARGYFEQSLAVIERVLGPEHPDVTSPLGKLAAIAGRAGRTEEALRLYRRSVAVTEKAFGPWHSSVVLPLYYMAKIETDRGNPAAARPLLERGLAIGRRAKAEPHGLAMVEIALGSCLTDLRQFAEAEPHLRPWSGEDVDFVVRRRALEALVGLYGAWGKPAEATRIRQTLDRIGREKPGDEFH
ncbi:MAG TPA: serine/threonine-protein kinase [Thermoanaerobaculia bacterium]|nr:serine/threonine-protein kinase [Thermoanaerobaculia bacterium]